MQSTNDKGFSLIELLLVVVIIGVIAALAVPAYQKATLAAENGTTIAAMRTISSAQLLFFSQNSRFGRLREINSGFGNGLGTMIGDRLVRGKYTFEMTPVADPTDLDLRSAFTITATRESNALIYKYELTQSGEIVQLLP